MGDDDPAAAQLKIGHHPCFALQQSEPGALSNLSIRRCWSWLGCDRRKGLQAPVASVCVFLLWAAQQSRAHRFGSGSCTRDVADAAVNQEPIGRASRHPLAQRDVKA